MKYQFGMAVTPDPVGAGVGFTEVKAGWAKPQTIKNEAKAKTRTKTHFQGPFQSPFSGFVFVVFAQSPFSGSILLCGAV